jgi:hypothetical protein
MTIKFIDSDFSDSLFVELSSSGFMSSIAVKFFCLMFNVSGLETSAVTLWLLSLAQNR